MECPNCGLHNPDAAQRCDCGYDFAEKTVKSSYYCPPKPKTLPAWRRFLVYLLFGIVALFGLGFIAQVLVGCFPVKDDVDISASEKPDE